MPTPVTFEPRCWPQITYTWKGSALCHKPLYFEEEQLERYGHTFGIAQPVVSGAHFFGTLPVLPYKMGIEMPWAVFVEDDDGVRFVGEDSLRRLGYTVLTARSGEEALGVSAAHAGRIAILVSDIVMPGMSGPDLYARLAVARPEMKLLFLSGYTPDAAVRHGFLDPSVALLEKPFGPDALARKVRGVLDA